MEYMPNGQLLLGQRGKDQGLSGFPGPLNLGRRVARRYFPSVYRKLSTLLHVEQRPVRKGKLKWLSEGLSDLVIGRNSEFNTEELSDEQLEELGGIE